MLLPRLPDYLALGAIAFLLGVIIFYNPSGLAGQDVKRSGVLRHEERILSISFRPAASGRSALSNVR